MAQEEINCIKQAFGWTAQNPRIWQRCMAGKVYCFVEWPEAVPEMKFVKVQIAASLYHNAR